VDHLTPAGKTRHGEEVDPLDVSDDTHPRGIWCISVVSHG
jgi:hypothetical protein